MQGGSGQIGLIPESDLVNYFPAAIQRLAIQIKAARFQYRAPESAAGFSLEVDGLEFVSGKVQCLFGTNGCGKTTLLKSMTGMLRPQAGAVLWNGIPAPPRLGRGVSLVLQAGMWPHWSVERNVIEPVLEAGMKGDEAVHRAALFISSLGLTGFENRRAHRLSAGQQQRVVLARALALSPDCLLLDEVMSAQSEYWARKIAELLRDFVTSGRLLILVSHDPEWVAAFGDTVTHLISDFGDDVAATRFYTGFHGDVAGWGRFREDRLRGVSARG